MKKATKKAAVETKEMAAPVANLGTKRVCPECSTRFYDFGRPEIVCPKCETKIDPAQIDPFAKLHLAQKKSPKVVPDEDAPVAMRAEDGDEGAAGIADDLDDISDDGDEVVEDIVSDDDEDEF